MQTDLAQKEADFEKERALSSQKGEFLSREIDRLKDNVDAKNKEASEWQERLKEVQQEAEEKKKSEKAAVLVDEQELAEAQKEIGTLRLEKGYLHT